MTALSTAYMLKKRLYSVSFTGGSGKLEQIMIVAFLFHSHDRRENNALIPFHSMNSSRIVDSLEIEMKGLPRNIFQYTVKRTVQDRIAYI